MALPPKKECQGYGFFGYEGAMWDQAIGRDNPEMLKDCVDARFVSANSKMLGPRTVLEHCEKFAPKCAAMLKSLG